MIDFENRLISIEINHVIKVKKENTILQPRSKSRDLQMWMNVKSAISIVQKREWLGIYRVGQKSDTPIQLLQCNVK